MVITLPPFFGFPNSGFKLKIDGYVEFTLDNNEKLLFENFKWVPGLHTTMYTDIYRKINSVPIFWDTLNDVQLF